MVRRCKSWAVQSVVVGAGCSIGEWCDLIRQCQVDALALGYASLYCRLLLELP